MKGQHRKTVIHVPRARLRNNDMTRLSGLSLGLASCLPNGKNWQCSLSKSVIVQFVKTENLFLMCASLLQVWSVRLCYSWIRHNP